MSVTIDFETRSTLSIKKTGPHTYASNPSTEVMCLAYKVDDGPVKLWHPAIDAVPTPFRECPPPMDLFTAILDGEEVEAHNAMFERCVWNYIMVNRYGWPAIHPHQWRCSASVAASRALPRKLEKACEAMDTDHKKNMDGNRVMQKLARPRKPTKNNPSVWHNATSDFETLFRYCMDDVEAEHSLSARIGKLSEAELAVWRIDQTMNWRGVCLDVPTTEAAIRLVADQQRRVDKRLNEVTNFAVDKHTKRTQFLPWLQSRGLDIDNTQAETLRRALADLDDDPDVNGDVREAITLWLSANKASVKKYKAAIERVAFDGRLHDTVVYHGASTGRWAGAGFQVQNVKRGYGEGEIDHVCMAIQSEDVDWLEMWEEAGPMDALANAIRGVLKAADGKILRAADYAAIEARGTFWLAGEEDALNVFRMGEDIYCYTASKYIFLRTVTKRDKLERFVGKQSVLGLGYQMGWPKWMETNHGFNVNIPIEEVRKLFGDDYDNLRRMALDPRIPEEAAGKWRQTIWMLRVHQKQVTPELVHEQLFAAYVVNAYRSNYPKVKALWKETEDAAVNAVLNRGQTFEVAGGKIKFKANNGWLMMRLPSGRLLYYRKPVVRDVRTKWGQVKKQVTHMAVDGPARKWRRIGTYGGKLVENAVQALSRDIMAAAMIRLEAAGYDLVLTVHDELVAETDRDFGSLEEFEELMAEKPAWAAGFPVAVEGWEGVRYRK